MNLSRIDTSKLYPPFLLKIEKMLEILKAKGLNYVATQGYRSPEEQAKLYAQGRTGPGKIVTNAKPFSSLHQFGLTIDFVFDSSATPGTQPSWLEKDYAALGAAAKEVGLIWGGTFKSIKDFPHVQLETKASLTSLKTWYQTGGMKRVWDQMSKL